MGYDELLKNIKQGLYWLDVNARHAIELQETFTFPAYDNSICGFVKGTDKARCYNLCLNALYFDFVMTLMRMYDSYERDTACFENVFDYLSDDFVLDFKSNTGKDINTDIAEAQKKYSNITGSHLLGSLRIVRHKIFAHTSIDFPTEQRAKYGYAEDLLARTLPMLNRLNTAINGKAEPYDSIHAHWKGFAKDFWQSMIK